MHRRIGMAPHEVTAGNEAAVWERLYADRLRAKPRRRAKAPALPVGTRVRLNKKHRVFQKSYLPGWTEEVFVVRRVVPRVVPSYRLQEWDGTPVENTFYQQDLKRVNMTDEPLFRVEKILQRKRRRIKVRWLGWPAKYDSWIDKGMPMRWDCFRSNHGRLIHDHSGLPFGVFSFPRSSLIP